MKASSKCISTGIYHEVNVATSGKNFLVKSCSYNEKLIQSHFTDVVLTGLQNENIGNKICPISRLNSLFQEEQLKNLSLAMFNKHEHSNKFNKHRTDISIGET